MRRSPDAMDVIARLDASSRIGEGKQAELWMDTSRFTCSIPTAANASRAELILSARR